MPSLYGIVEIVAMQYRLFNESTTSFSYLSAGLLFALVCDYSDCMINADQSDTLDKR